MSDATVLVTGYEPFGEFETNPTRRIAQRLDEETIGGDGTTATATATVVGRDLPVVFDEMEAELEALLEEYDPDIVCGLGLAAGRNALALERVGINLRDTAGTPDNDDREVTDEAVDAEGPNAYFATLPLREMKSTMQEAGVPTTLSTDAGTHLCNDLLYAARHRAETGDREFRAGFVHTPLSHEAAARRDEGEPSVALETTTRGVRDGLAVAVETLE
ncbi:pyroglutamyl-peptidase I family protein [Natronobacterium gregoryi]|uniref:Pyroglutamyl peptidase I n=2 Tax=Natronobacterium gregoryi TaxID=44930 RepID=L0AIL7_NATGS|nr:pyrrolidone-carboxylate peptidase [Natronobacterium gregoryi]AFZ73289.1 pyroglutamyl peptidase I [Natronobacterium gregoryi SP2]ELY73933.1 pyrrolidone-carboxylate peptidase [Natronobacterium gregoryi SP2]PLK19914.1 pyrrolidone-carboxylate peptidase [Natronobacterium gregoryi SP2]SFJ38238.1 pyroglutamyl-peptidase I Cysteine peptidase. MEROPS family C15 [Natronobacterium gregoryi]